MQLRKVSKIDEEKCTGCGICTQTCHEGALQLVNGKAKLISASQCDGLGICLPVCPNGAITLEEQPVTAAPASAPANTAFQCPGSRSNRIERKIGWQPTARTNNRTAITIAAMALSDQTHSCHCQLF